MIEAKNGYMFGIRHCIIYSALARVNFRICWGGGGGAMLSTKIKGGGASTN